MSRTPARSDRQGGFTLLELIVFILVISIGFVGILSVFNVTGRNSADPMQQKQMLTIAEAMLAEILTKDYENDPADPTNTSATLGCTPNTTPRCSTNSLTERQNYNDVSDYAGFATTGIYAIDGSAVAGLSAYNLTVAVTATTLSGVAAKRVSNAGSSLSLDGYRTNYGG
jgi:MSHA pilin protein MshD